MEYQKTTGAAQSFSPNAMAIDVRPQKKASSKKRKSKAVDRVATPQASGSRK